MASIYPIKKYIHYLLKAKNEHSIHSPFVFKLYTEVIASKTNYYDFSKLDNLRKQLLSNQKEIEVLDLGVGSKKMNSTRKISDIAKYSLVTKKHGELLFKLVNYLRPDDILELGTSLGLSSLYMSYAIPKTSITSIEGCPNTYNFAGSVIANSRVQNIETINDSFEHAFETILSHKNFDFVFIDGNHSYEATIKYFNELLNNIHENSLLIFDDIYWTPGMTKAWEEIKTHTDVTISIDLYKMGLVFFRKENKQKEHFCLRF